MDNLFTTVTSSITRLNCTGAYFVGQHGLYQVAKVQFKNGRLGERKLIVLQGQQDPVQSRDPALLPGPPSDQKTFAIGEGQ